MNGRVGLVIVSHSAALAEATVELATQMTPEPPPIATAAGTADGGLGTDATAVAEAIDRVAGECDDVVVLMDLGSAVLSAEMALEFAGTPARLCSAPLVEGTVAAVVAAASGGSVEEVIAEARDGLRGKTDQIGDGRGVGGDDHRESSIPERTDAEPSQVRRVRLVNPLGLHLRPASLVVATAAEHTATLTVVAPSGRSASAASVTGLSALGAVGGDEVELRASGEDAEALLEAVGALVTDGFGETEEMPGTEAETTTSPMAGPLGAAPGVGLGPAWRLADALGGGTDADVLAEERVHPGDPETQRADLDRARETVESSLRRTAGETRGEQRQVASAHLALVADADLHAGARRAMDEGADADTAWRGAVTTAVDALLALPDERQRERAVDVRSVGAAVLRALRGVERTIRNQPGIVLADDLTPELVSLLDPEIVAAAVLAGGSPTSHAAIIARSIGLPLVTGADALVDQVNPGTELLVDGASGEVTVDPDESRRAAARQRVENAARTRARARQRAHDPAVTTAGRTVEVAANVGSVADAERAREAGADGIGLLRTELLFLDRDRLPDTDEQERLYRRVAETMEGRRVVIRTLDVGGDKPLPSVRQPHEANPFLGVRGLRLSLTAPEVFVTQLRAIVRVAHDHPIGVMFPMVTTADELDQARRRLEEVTDAEGGWPEGLLVGAMVEVPALALRAADMVDRVDFLSIGTNDLTQYVQAAERGNAGVAHLAQGLTPAVADLVAGVCAAGEPAGVRVAVCGELAGDPAAVPTLLAAGVDELSVAPPLVPSTKQQVRES